jgi:hypothetical protein
MIVAREPRPRDGLGPCRHALDRGGLARAKAPALDANCDHVVAKHTVGLRRRVGNKVSGARGSRACVRKGPSARGITAQCRRPTAGKLSCRARRARTRTRDIASQEFREILRLSIQLTSVERLHRPHYPPLLPRRGHTLAFELHERRGERRVALAFLTLLSLELVLSELLIR